MVRIWRRLSRPAAWRTAFAVAISAALVVSLVRMPCCDGLTAEGAVTVAAFAVTDAGTGIVDVAEAVADAAVDWPAQSSHGPIAHCDHCLVHVSFEPFANGPYGLIEFTTTSVTLPNDAAPAGVAGPPLFEPPRA